MSYVYIYCIISVAIQLHTSEASSYDEKSKLKGKLIDDKTEVTGNSFPTESESKGSTSLRRQSSKSNFHNPNKISDSRRTDHEVRLKQSKSSHSKRQSENLGRINYDPSSTVNLQSKFYSEGQTSEYPSKFGQNPIPTPYNPPVTYFPQQPANNKRGESSASYCEGPINDNFPNLNLQNQIHQPQQFTPISKTKQKSNWSLLRNCIFPSSSAAISRNPTNTQVQNRDKNKMPMRINEGAQIDESEQNKETNELWNFIKEAREKGRKYVEAVNKNKGALYAAEKMSGGKIKAKSFEDMAQYLSYIDSITAKDVETAVKNGLITSLQVASKYQNLSLNMKIALWAASRIVNEVDFSAKDGDGRNLLERGFQDVARPTVAPMYDSMAERVRRLTEPIGASLALVGPQDRTEVNSRQKVEEMYKQLKGCLCNKSKKKAISSFAVIDRWPEKEGVALKVCHKFIRHPVFKKDRPFLNPDMNPVFEVHGISLDIDSQSPKYVYIQRFVKCATNFGLYFVSPGIGRESVFVAQMFPDNELHYVWHLKS